MAGSGLAIAGLRDRGDFGALAGGLLLVMGWLVAVPTITVLDAVLWAETEGQPEIMLMPGLGQSATGLTLSGTF